MPRAYDEPIGDVRVDDHGDPLSWRWRDRRYTAVRVIDWWTETGQWWHDPYGEAREILHYRIEARSAYGYGVVQLARDSDHWLLVTIVAVGASEPPPDAAVDAAAGPVVDVAEAGSAARPEPSPGSGARG